MYDQHGRRVLQQPGEGDLEDRGAVAFGDTIEDWVLEGSGREREPGNKGQTFAFTVCDLVLPLPIRHIVEVLHRDDWQHFASSLDLGYGDFRESNMPNEPFTLKLSHRLQLLLFGHLRIDPMELPQFDPLQAKSLQALLEIAAQKFRPAVLDPLVRPGAL